MVNLNISNIQKSLTKNVDKIAGLYGYHTVMTKAFPGISLPDEFMKPINNLLAGKIPSLEKIIWRITSAPYSASTINNAIMLYIISEILDQIKIGGKYPKIGKKAAIGLGFGAVIAAVAAGESPAGDPHITGMFQRNVLSANQTGYSY